MTKASDNDFPSILWTEQGSTPTTPAASHQRLFIRTSDHTLCYVNSSGTVSQVSTGGGGGITHSYLGYNTAGGSNETMTAKRVYAKKITVAAAGIITAIYAYVKDDGADHVSSLSAALYADVAGTPGKLLSYVKNPIQSLLPETATSTTAYGWVAIPCGVYVTAADYWIAVVDFATSNPLVIAYDGSGSDRYYTSGGEWFTDWGFYSPTTSSNKYSIRASIIS